MRVQAWSRRRWRRDTVAPGDHVTLSWVPSCGSCEECVRDLPQLCSIAWSAMGRGGLLDGTTRLSRDGQPVHHFSMLSSFAEACVVPERSCVPIPATFPSSVAALVGCGVTTGVGAVWSTARVRPGDRVAVIGCGGVGLSALMAAVAVGAEPMPRGRRRAQAKLDIACEFGATAASLGRDGRGDAAASAPRPAVASTMRSRPPVDPRRCSRHSSPPALAAPRC